MRLNRRTNTIIMYILAIGLLVGMVVTFTPTIGGFGGAGDTSLNTPVVTVNNQPITDEQVSLSLQRNPFFNAVQEGEVAEDLRLMLIDQMIDNELLRQAAARERVSSAEVNARVNEFRSEAGVAGRQNDQAYLSVIGGMGYTDASFRRAVEMEMRQERYINRLLDGATVSDEDVRQFYELNRRNYLAEERIVARQIVVDDEALARELHARAVAGEDFADLAREHSAVNPDRDGAIGAPQGSTEPQPVGRVALPTPVANAAFGLRGPGLTGVIDSGGRYYVVQVSDYVTPDPLPFEEVSEQVREDALAAQRNAVLESALENLRADAQIVTGDASIYLYRDYPVARVGNREIMASDLARVTYGNQQTQQFLSPGTADLIPVFFKPAFLDALIEQELAYQGAQELPVGFLGTRQQVASSAEAFVTQDVVVSEEDVEAFYQENPELFTVGPNAVTTRADFASEEDALAFREAIMEGESVEDAAEAHGGTLLSLGTVTPGLLEPELDSALFNDQVFSEIPELPGQEVSEVLVLEEEVAAPDPDEAAVDEAAVDEAAVDEAVGEDEAAEEATAEDAATEETVTDEAVTDEFSTEDVAAEVDAAEGEVAEEALAEDEVVEDEVAEDEPATASQNVYVVLVASRSPEQLRPFAEVRDQVEQQLLNERRAEVRETWLEELRARVEVENYLEAAAAPTPTTTMPDITFEPEFAAEDIDTELIEVETLEAETDATDPGAPSATETETTEAEAPADIETSEATEADAAEEVELEATELAEPTEGEDVDTEEGELLDVTEDAADDEAAQEAGDATPEAEEEDAQ